MPPTKKTGATATGSPTKFSWTPENDRILLLCCLGRNTTPADYQTFIAALPAGANFQGVRQRISKLRVEQRALYEEHGWDLPTEAGVRAKGAKAGGKRKAGADEEEEEGGEGREEGGKRGRGKKVKIEEEGGEESVKDQEGGEEEVV